MASSAEQIHQGSLNLEAKRGSEYRLYVDLNACQGSSCKQCVIECSYFYHPDNIGVLSVTELASYALACRRCDDPHCVAACPADALEQLAEKDNLLIRHNMRCVGCKTCSHACPYGTIYPENVPLLIHVCDFCFDRRDQDGEPMCIGSCPYGALALHSSDQELSDDDFVVGDNLIIHSTHWMREKA